MAVAFSYSFVLCTVGRVLNRLSKDTASIDSDIPDLLGAVWNVSINVLANFVAVYGSGGAVPRDD